MVERNIQTNARRNTLREAYKALCAAGKIRPLTRLEVLQFKAAGHPEREDTQAAIRILKKKGLWNEGEHSALMKEREGE